MSEARESLPLHLAIIRQAYNPYGGAERFVERAMRALGSNALQLTLITRSWSGDTQPGIVVRQIATPHLGRMLRDYSFTRQVQALLRRERFDLVQSHERIPGCQIFRAGDGVHATWLELRARTLGPIARFAQKISPWHNLILAMERRMFAHAALRAVICNSNMVRNDIARRYPALAPRLHVIHNGIDLQRFHPALREQHRLAVRAQLGIAEHTRVLLFIGSGFVRKGVPQLIEAMAHPDLQQDELWIIGKDKQTRRLAARAEALGLSSRVRFLGAHKDVTPYLGAADVFALPTHYDPMPNAALEALASGLPVLSSQSSGAAELITPGENGEIVNALDVPGIAAALGKLLAATQDPAQLAVIRIKTRASVAQMDNESMATALLALYRQLLEPASQL